MCICWQAFPIFFISTYIFTFALCFLLPYKNIVWVFRVVFFSLFQCFIMQSCSHHIKKTCFVHNPSLSLSMHNISAQLWWKYQSSSTFKWWCQSWSLSFDSNCIVFPDFLSIIYTLDPYSSPHTAEEKVWSMRRHQSYCNG